MRLRPRSRPTPFLNRGDQYRLLGLCTLLILVLFAMERAAQPETWAWLFGDAAQPAREPTLKDLDLRPLDAETGMLRSDAVVISRAPDEEEWQVEEPAESAETHTETPTTSVELPQESIAEIVDGVLGMRRAEAPAYWQALTNVDRLPPEAFQEASIGAVRFPVLMSDPRAYLGQVITVQGRLKLLQGFPVPENEHGIERLYEGWMLSADSGDNPWRLIFTRIPEGFALGENQDEPVIVTGYFFKRFGYEAAQGFHLAPMVVVSEVRRPPVLPPGEQEALARDLSRVAWWFLGGLIIGTVCLVWYFRASDRRFQKSRAARIAAQRGTPQVTDLEALKSVPVIDPQRPFDEPR